MFGLGTMMWNIIENRLNLLETHFSLYIYFWINLYTWRLFYLRALIKWMGKFVTEKERERKRKRILKSTLVHICIKCVHVKIAVISSRIEINGNFNQNLVYFYFYYIRMFECTPFTESNLQTNKQTDRKK